MKKVFYIIMAVLFVFQIVKPVAAKTADGKLVEKKPFGKKDGVEITKIIYMSDGLKVSGLLFTEKPSEKLPCVIFAHDGISGISKEHRLASIRLAKQGFAVFSPSYRGEDDSEGEIEIAKGEVRDVLNAMVMLSDLPQVDKDKIGFAGFSHGALISMLAASRTAKVKAVVAGYGVMDIYKWWDYLKENDKIGKDRITRQTYGDGPEDRPVSFKIRNAVSYVDKIKAPVLILQGEKDDIVPPGQAKYLKQALDKHKIRNKMVIYPNCLHGFIIYVPFLKDETIEESERNETEQAWKEMVDFLNTHLK
ncbi:MAG: alpha/beta hydrolase family protein [Vulcanimicrobiota bacterium]